MSQKDFIDLPNGQSPDFRIQYDPLGHGGCSATASPCFIQNSVVISDVVIVPAKHIVFFNTHTCMIHWFLPCTFPSCLTHL